MCLLFGLVSAAMQLPSALSDWLIFLASSSVSPLALVLDTVAINNTQNWQHTPQQNADTHLFRNQPNRPNLCAQQKPKQNKKNAMVSEPCLDVAARPKNALNFPVISVPTRVNQPIYRSPGNAPSGNFCVNSSTNSE